MNSKNVTKIKSSSIFPIKPFYTTSDLKVLIKYKTNDGCRNFLNRLNIPKKLLGKTYYYFLSDIQTYCPELFASICEAANLTNLMIQPDVSFETDEEQYSVQQFR